MKILTFFLLIGWASASFHEMLDDASHEWTLSFLEGMEKGPSLAQHLGLTERSAEAEQLEDAIKTELGRKLKEGVDRILEKVKEAINEGRNVKQELLNKLKELREKLRDIQEKAGDKGKEFVQELKEQARDYLKKVLEKYGLNKRSAEGRLEEALAELNYRDLLKKIKEHLQNNVDPELIKEQLEKMFSEGSEILRRLLKTLKEKGAKKLEMLIDALLGDEEDRQARGIKDYWEKVKDYFKDLKIDLDEKYMKFGEWVKNKWDTGMENSKDKMANITAIAKEFAKHAKNVSKEVGAEAMDFFQQYKKDLGNVWEELQEVFQNIRNRQD